jgi:hypothetical protein
MYLVDQILQGIGNTDSCEGNSLPVLYQIMGIRKRSRVILILSRADCLQYCADKTMGSIG